MDFIEELKKINGNGSHQLYQDISGKIRELEIKKHMIEVFILLSKLTPLQEEVAKDLKEIQLYLSYDSSAGVNQLSTRAIKKNGEIIEEGMYENNNQFKFADELMSFMDFFTGHINSSFTQLNWHSIPLDEKFSEKLINLLMSDEMLVMFKHAQLSLQLTSKENIISKPKI